MASNNRGRTPIDLTKDSDDEEKLSSPKPKKPFVPLPESWRERYGPGAASTPKSTAAKPLTIPFVNGNTRTVTPSKSSSGPNNAIRERERRPYGPTPQSTSKPSTPVTATPRRDGQTLKPSSIEPTFKPSPNGHTSTPTPPTASNRPTQTKASASTSSTNGLRNEIRYTPVFTGAGGIKANGATPAQQPEKRRKLSVPGTQATTLSHSRNGSGSLTNGNGVDGLAKQGTEEKGTDSSRVGAIPPEPRVATLATNSRPTAKSKPNHKMPSVQTLNSALKSNGVKSPFLQGISTTQPGALHIGRVPTEGDDLGLVSTSTKTAGTSAAAQRVQGATKAQPGSVDIEEVLVDREESVSSNLVFRTPPAKKPPTSTKKPRHDDDHSVEPRIDGATSVIPSSAPLKPSPVPASPSHRPNENRDSVIPGSDSHEQVASIPAKHSPNHQEAPQSRTPVMAPVVRRDASQKLTGQFSEEEDHLLIFLKEVRKLQWKDITVQFNLDYPGRKYHNLQSRYSSKLNKRDRSLDPPKLKLPARYDSERDIDWAIVHQSNPGPLEAHGLAREAATLQRDVQPGKLHNHALGRPAFQDPGQDYSSGAESAPRRPRRAVPVKNYTLPRKIHDWQLHSQATDEITEDNFGFADPMDVDMQPESDGSTEEQAPIPERAIPVDNEPITADFDQADAVLALSTHKQQLTSFQQKLPYLSSSQRRHVQNAPGDWEYDQLCSREWQGSLIHVDFSAAEVDVVERAVTMMTGDSSRLSRLRSRRKRLRESLAGLTEPKLLKLSNDIRHHLPHRDRESINAFLQDARDGRIRGTQPHIERLAAARPNRHFSSAPKASMSSMIRQRELGVHSRRGWKAASTSLSYQMKNKVQDSLGPAFSYTGASSDVHALAWSVDGQCFAAGAICVDDPHSMQYNRPNNLLYGDITYKTIYELGEHVVDRQRPESGPNSTLAMHASQDPNLFQTVTSVAFSPDGRFMYSGGYDQLVCLWSASTDGSQPELLSAMKHNAKVDAMAVSRQGLLATASRKATDNAIKLIMIDEEDPTRFARQNLSSKKAQLRPDLSILPNSLQFDPRDGNLLLAGFGANVKEDGRDTTGDICLWDMNGCTPLTIWGSGKNVFDVAFHPRNPWFAVGCVAGANVNRGTKSIVRLYDDHGNDGRYSMRMELECKALDMNDVVWCPGDDYLVAAGCTSGRAYVWDIRWPDRFLRELAHGRSLMPLDDRIDREITDTGIRYLSWGDNATRLYTGSSDGIVKLWNVTGSEEETFVKDLVTMESGIMSGALSPDKSKLVIGEVNGSINVLEVGRDDCSLKEAETLKYFKYQELQDDDEDDLPPAPTAADSGVAAGVELLETGEIIHVPMGGLPIRQAVQGPNYAGPFDRSVDALFLREQALEFQYNLSRAHGPQCDIPLCKEGVVKITSEESGDSGRSVDRIPDELRQHWKAIGSDIKVVPGKFRCTSCGRAARPFASASAAKSDEAILCERCSFACFRCGAVNKVPPATQKFTCNVCRRTWDVGALGYECIEETGSHADVSDVPSLDGYREDLHMAKRAARGRPEQDVSFGDEMNALTDYYFSLAIDRPESPPL